MPTIKVKFDIDKDNVFCGYCGTERVIRGHMTSTFLMCPKHGEFTIGPTIMLNDGNPFDPDDNGDGLWYIHHEDEINKMMWETCALLDSPPSG